MRKLRLVYLRQRSNHFRAVVSFDNIDADYFVQLMRCFTIAVNDNIVFTVMRLKTAVSVQFEVDLTEADKWHQSQQ